MINDLHQVSPTPSPLHQERSTTEPEHAGSWQGRVVRVLTSIATAISDFFTKLFHTLFGCCFTDNPINRIFNPRVYGPYYDGIENAGNSCYLNAVVQGLRMYEWNPQLLQTTETGKKLLAILQTLQSNETVKAADIHDFRLHLIKEGFLGEVGSQEDALQVFNCILEKLKMPRQVQHRLVSEHHLPFFLYTFDDPQITTHTDNSVLLPIPVQTSNAGSPMNIQQLVNGSAITEEFVPDQVINRVLTDPRNTEEQTTHFMQFLEQKNNPSQVEVPVVRSIQLNGANLPRILPITLVRFTNDMQKNSSPVIPSEEITLKHYDNPQKCSRYQLCSIVIHAGATLQGGHYYTYTLQEKNGKKIWMQYNDSQATDLLNTSQDINPPAHLPEAALKDAVNNGYIFFYRLME